MSCFSDAYFYCGENIEDVINILKNANLHGFIYPPKNNWILFAVEGEELRLNPAVVQQNAGLLIYMIFIEDHGWEYTVFDGCKQISKYSCRWDFSVKYRADDSFNWLFDKLRVNIEPIRNLLFPAEDDIMLLYNNNPADAFCQLLGLRIIDYFSYEYIKRAIELYRQDEPEILEI